MKSRLVPLLMLLSGSLLWAAPQARYQIEGELDVDRYTISGNETLQVRNSSQVPLSHLFLFLYPNKFRRRSPQLDEINYRWHYPEKFDPGWLKLEQVREASEGSLAVEPQQLSTLAAGVVVRLPLAKPLAVGESRTFRIRFRTRIPNKFGPFGHYHHTLTLQGGWYPYLVPWDKQGHPHFEALPELSLFQLRLKLNRARDAVLNGKFFQAARQIDLPASEARYLTLVLTPKFHRILTRQVGSRRLVWYSTLVNRYHPTELVDALAQVAEDALAYFPQGGSGDIPVVETHLRSVMSYPGSGMILLSDRFYYAVAKFDLRKLNLLEAAQAIGYFLVADRVARREAPSAYNWISEALAWAFRNHYMRAHFPHLSNLRETAGNMGMFRPFNRMATSPTIPFAETYIVDVVERDSFRESLFYFNNRLPSGQGLTEKLERIVGREQLERVVSAYLRAHRSFRRLAEQVSGRDLDAFFEEWTGGYPENLDYRLVRVERNRKQGSGYHTTFRVEKRGAGGLVEPVDILVETDGGARRLLTWDGQGEGRDFEIDTPRKVRRIEVDPFHLSPETDDANNLSPHPMEMVIDRGDFNASTAGFGAATRIRMHRARDFTRWMFVSPFFSPAVYGAEAGMILNFGSQVGKLSFKRTQEMSLGYVITGLRSGFADPDSGRLDGQGKTAGLRLRYTFDNQKFEEDPSSAQHLGMVATLYRSELGSDFNFYQVQMEASEVYAINTRHKLAGRVLLGYSDGFGAGDEIPAQNLFDLALGGGLGTLDTGRHLAENMLSATLEWRHDLMSDLDGKMPMNWVRRIQGVLALEAGWVSPRFGQLFRANQTIYGIRYGFRFHYDFLGIRPSDVTFDIGHRLGSSQKEGTIISFGILQWF